ncbi:MAG: hypothetical protein JWN23_1385 [Rhodocyclales bacterium]|nr:hypothetical protein [Rhodocyclales bacterium]
MQYAPVIYGPRAARRARSPGFTLIEVLVVMLIVGITIGAVSVNFGLLDRRNTADEVERLRRVLEFAAERAAVHGSPIQVEFLPGSYRFSQLDTAGKWQLLFEPRELAEHDWRAGLAPQALSIAGHATEPGNPHIVFSAEAPPFELHIATPDGAHLLSGRSTGEVDIDAADNIGAAAQGAKS